MNRKLQLIIANIKNSLIGIAVELAFIFGILLIALFVSFILSGIN